MGSVDVIGGEAVLNARSPISIAYGPDDRLLHRQNSVVDNTLLQEADAPALVHGVLTERDLQRLDQEFRRNDTDGNGEMSKVKLQPPSLRT